MPAPVIFCDHVRHVPRREELALLDVDDTAGLGRGHEEIGLTAQERRDLQHVDGFGDPRALRGLMDIGEHRHAELLRISAKIGSACSSPMPRAPLPLVRFALSNEVL